jgi:RNA:NAD 2'-phosphotransferase (TPT1/KptA family)
MLRLKPQYPRSMVKKLVDALSQLMRHDPKKIAAAAADHVAVEAVDSVVAAAVATAAAAEATAVDAVVTEVVAAEAEADVAAVAEDATNITKNYLQLCR